MNIFGALLFLQGHITNVDLARQLAAGAEGDGVANPRAQDTPPQDVRPTTPGSTLPCRSA